jgi:alpha-beta hydrolase superfamily lysophospholipase
MNRVVSNDGTSIAYDRQGTGPAVFLVGGGLDDGAENAQLATELAQHFTVYNYARRGRGESGDTPPYAVAREIEDIAALIDEAGGSAHLYGVSSGGALVTGGTPDPHLAGGPIDFNQAADAVAASIPHARRLILEGQGHVAGPKAVAVALEQFFTGE